MKTNIKNAHINNQAAMLTLINQFDPYLKKWAKWLNYEIGKEYYFH
jgi:hypothetical protein